MRLPSRNESHQADYARMLDLIIARHGWREYSDVDATNCRAEALRKEIGKKRGEIRVGFHSQTTQDKTCCKQNERARALMPASLSCPGAAGGGL